MTTEASVQSVAVDYLQTRGWLVAHFRPARTERGWRTPGQYDAQGFPDLAIARNGVVDLIEVKSGRGRISEHQTRWLEASGGFLLTPNNIDDMIGRYR